MAIGSADIAFDVLEDCHSAGLDATMAAQSPTYMVPLEYIWHKTSLGTYDGGVDEADSLFLSLRTVVDGQLGRKLFATLASVEPERHAAPKASGFRVLDSREPTCALMHNLLERAGGHYVDVGGTQLIEEKKASLKAGMSPSTIRNLGYGFRTAVFLCGCDHLVYCSADSNLETTAAEIVGVKLDVYVAEAETSAQSGQGHVLTSRDIPSCLDATWGVDEEGETRGIWKCHSNAENVWFMGGYTQQHRWHWSTLSFSGQSSPLRHSRAGP
ncbi:hypothetical protein BDV10DRAFT_187593 [Aspergillus recurvatus]